MGQRSKVTGPASLTPLFGTRVLSLPVLLQVIAPEEIVDPNVDEHSVMTYLSQFPKAKLKPGAPLRAKTLHPKRAKAYGPGKPPPTDPTENKSSFSINKVEE